MVSCKAADLDPIETIRYSDNRLSLKNYLCICMKQILYSRSRIIEALIHIIGWGIVFAFPFVMMTRSGFTITWMEYLRHGSIVPLSFLIVFYCNYCFLIPRYLFEGAYGSISC